MHIKRYSWRTPWSQALFWGHMAILWSSERLFISQQYNKFHWCLCNFCARATVSKAWKKPRTVSVSLMPQIPAEFHLLLISPGRPHSTILQLPKWHFPSGPWNINTQGGNQSKREEEEEKLPWGTDTLAPLSATQGLKQAVGWISWTCTPCKPSLREQI